MNRSFEESPARQRGFTLIELMIVVVVIGILAGIAIPNYASVRRKSVRASCIANQRNIAQGASLYASEGGVINAVINVNVLQVGGYVSMPTSECPQSTVKDYDDYTITITAGQVTDVHCSNNGAHDWNGLF